QERRQDPARRVLPRPRHRRGEPRGAAQRHHLHRAGRGRNERGPRALVACGRTAHGQAAHHSPVPAEPGPRGIQYPREADRRSGEGHLQSMRVMRNLVKIALILLLVTPVTAAEFPTKPVELTVLFGAGSAADLLARKRADLAGKELVQPVPAVNRTAAGAPAASANGKGAAPAG